MNLRLFLSAIFILVSQHVWSYQNDLISDHIIEDFFQKAGCSIDRIEQDRVYLRPETLSFHKGNIFLQAEQGQGIQLPHLFTSDAGPYVILAGMQKIWICTTSWCQTVYYEEPIECLKCHTRSFIIRYL